MLIIIIMRADNKMELTLQSDRRLAIMKKTKTVLLWGREDLLSSSVEFFLASKNRWEVISLCNKDGTDALLKAVDSIQPNVVIIHLGEHDDPEKLPMALFQTFPALKVITVSLENNSVQIYNKQRVWIKDAADLLLAVEA